MTRALLALAPARFLAIGSASVKRIVRDPINIAVLAMAAIPVTVFGLGGDAIDGFFERRAGIEDFTETIKAFLLVLPAILLGWICGMLSLEERDEHVLLAMSVTPIGGGLLLHRALFTGLLAFGLTALSLPILAPGCAQPFLISALITMEALAVAFGIVAFAGNTVEGLALSKTLSPAAFAALLPLFSSPLRFLGGVVPTFWIGEILSDRGAPAGPAIIGAAIAVHVGAALIFLVLALRRTEN